MRPLSLVFFVLLVFSFASAQSRDEAIKNLDNLRQQIKTQESIILAPSNNDIKSAAKEGVSLFRILPSEIFNGKMTIRGGGAYYTFTQNIQEYNNSDLSLSRGNFNVGFAGADYGFLYDLGETPLDTIFLDSENVTYLSNYSPPSKEPEIRIEQRKAQNYEANGITYKSSVPAVAGHTYVLRSINFGDWDVMVAFKVHRKDTDGSMIIFWKILKEFDKPEIERN